MLQAELEAVDLGSGEVVVGANQEHFIADLPLHLVRTDEDGRVDVLVEVGNRQQARRSVVPLVGQVDVVGPDRFDIRVAGSPGAVVTVRRLIAVERDRRRDDAKPRPAERLGQSKPQDHLVVQREIHVQARQEILVVAAECRQVPLVAAERHKAGRPGLGLDVAPTDVAVELHVADVGPEVGHQVDSKRLLFDPVAVAGPFVIAGATAVGPNLPNVENIEGLAELGRRAADR